MDAMVPGSVAVAESRCDIHIDLYPEESAQIENAADVRVAEFTTVRGCARSALSQLGADHEGPLLRGESGAPIWPTNVSGSMTHCAGYRGAAVAFTRDFVSIGIDAELNEPLPEGVLDLIARPEELAMLAQLDATHVCWDRVLFSAKEATYKTWFPMTKEWLDFGEASLEILPSGVFAAHVLKRSSASASRRFERVLGRWRVTDGLVLTAIALSRDT